MGTPAIISPPPSVFRTASFWLSLVACLACSAPLWWPGTGVGGHDWGYAQNVWQVRWQSLLDYGQWPAHNPWQGGGLPVNPSFGYFSLSALGTLLAGPAVGLKLMLAGYYLIGALGFWRLGGVILGTAPGPRAFLTVLGTASPALAAHLATGHVIFANILVWPAIFAYLLDARRDAWSGLKAGLLFALGFNELPYYAMQYGGVLLVGLALWQWRAGHRPGRVALGRFAILAIVAALPFMLPSLIELVSVARDYSRIANTPLSFSAVELWQAHFIPPTQLKAAVFVPTIPGWWGNWEVLNYLGWGATVFFVAGLLLRPRWFHLAAFMCFIFTLGNLHGWEPMRWLMATPLFAPLQAFARLRLFTHLFFAVGAAWGVAVIHGRTGQPGWLCGAVLIASLASLAEVLVVSHGLARCARVAIATPAVANEQAGQFYQRAERRGLPAGFDGWPADLPLYTRANIGIVRESAAIDSPFRQPNQVRTVNDADYIGEFVQNGRAVTPSYWSPNHITFDRLDPSAPLLVNLNRGSPWRNFGQPLFPQDRIVEFEKPFTVQPDVQGRVDLTYVLPAQRAAWWCALAAFGLNGGICLYIRSKHSQIEDK